MFVNVPYRWTVEIGTWEFGVWQWGTDLDVATGDRLTFVCYGPSYFTTKSLSAPVVAGIFIGTTIVLVVVATYLLTHSRRRPTAEAQSALRL